MKIWSYKVYSVADFVIHKFCGTSAAKLGKGVYLYVPNVQQAASYLSSAALYKINFF